MRFDLSCAQLRLFSLSLPQASLPANLRARELRICEGVSADLFKRLSFDEGRRRRLNCAPDVPVLEGFEIAFGAKGRYLEGGYMLVRANRSFFSSSCSRSRLGSILIVVPLGILDKVHRKDSRIAGRADGVLLSEGSPRAVVFVLVEALPPAPLPAPDHDHDLAASQQQLVGRLGVVVEKDPHSVSAATIIAALHGKGPPVLAAARLVAATAATVLQVVV
jgi:hypothetical protein